MESTKAHHQPPLNSDSLISYITQLSSLDELEARTALEKLSKGAGDATVSKKMAKQCKIEKFLASKDVTEVNLALDFCSNVLKNNPEVEYTDFTKEQVLLDRIKRGESSRQWAEIDDLGTTQDELSKAFEEHGKTVGSAFQELYNHIEKVKEQLSEDIKRNKNENIRLNNYIEVMRDKQPDIHPSSDPEPKSATEKVNNVNKAFDSVDTKMDEIELFINEKVIKRLDLVEQHEDQFGEQITSVINKMKFLSEKSTKIEEQISENRTNNLMKTNSIYETLDDIKQIVQKKVNRLEKLVIDKENQDIPSYSDMKVSYEKIKKLEEQVLAMRTYQNELDEVFGLQSKEMDSLIKMTANNNYIKIKEMETNVERTRKELSENCSILDLKMKEIMKDMDTVKKNKKRLESLEWAENDSAKLEVLIAESEQLWTFVQGFVDEQSVTKTKVMMDLELKLTERMNALEWVSRNAIYLTPDALNNCISAFKLQYNNDNQNIINSYIFSSHQSDLIHTISSKLETLGQLERNDQNDRKIYSQLSLLEPSLINDMNLEIALSKNIHTILLRLLNIKLLLDKENKNQVPCLKYLMRCLASSLRTEESITLYINIKDCIKKLGAVLKYINDQEILANTSKCLRLCCKNEQNIMVVKKDCKDFPNILVDTLHKNAYSLIIFQEILLALKYYTVALDAIPSLDINNLKILVELHKESQNEKVRNNIKTILVQCARILEYEDELNKLNAGHILIS
ncbi:unnamed protein product [Moneuplotes crassus]|uniref:Uncharacterized protein n=1 Tax=Euplotes crassus TaxID=5936 RepID=A0AAD2DBY9_EUPCR|nr:unnamed protein product [Moneuplotes crassus]